MIVVKVVPMAMSVSSVTLGDSLVAASLEVTSLEVSSYSGKIWGTPYGDGFYVIGDRDWTQVKVGRTQNCRERMVKLWRGNGGKEPEIGSWASHVIFLRGGLIPGLYGAGGKSGDSSNPWGDETEDKIQKRLRGVTHVRGKNDKLHVSRAGLSLEQLALSELVSEAFFKRFRELRGEVERRLEREAQKELARKLRLDENPLLNPGSSIYSWESPHSRFGKRELRWRSEYMAQHLESMLYRYSVIRFHELEARGGKLDSVYREYALAEKVIQRFYPGRYRDEDEEASRARALGLVQGERRNAYRDALRLVFTFDELLEPTPQLAVRLKLMEEAKRFQRELNWKRFYPRGVS